MAFIGKLSGVEGRRVFLGERLYVAPDGSKVKKSEVPQGGFFPASNDYERTFTLKQDGKVLRAKAGNSLARANWPKATEAHLSDLKNGQDVCVCGVAPDAVSGECHSIIFVPLT